MKKKAEIFIVISVLLITGALYISLYGSHRDISLDHRIETLAGDETSLNGLEVDLNYKTGGKVIKSKLTFNNDGLNEETVVARDKGDQGWSAREFYQDMFSERDYQKLEIWLMDHYGEYTHAIKDDQRGYFYRRPPEELADGILSGYFFNTSDFTDEYRSSIEKQELQKDNGIYLIEYKAKENADYVVEPDTSTTRLMIPLSDNCVIRKMGVTEDSKFLEVLYTKEGRLRMKAVDLNSETEVADMDLFSEKDAAKSLVVYFPGDIMASGESDITLVGCEKGLVVIKTGGGSFEKVVDRTFSEEDSPSTIGKFMDHSIFRSTKACLKDDKFVLLSRVVKTDSIYPEHKGTHIMVYEGEDLGFCGIISSSYYRSDDEKLYDTYCGEYIDYMNNDGWIYEEDEPELSDEMMYSNIYDIEYVGFESGDKK